MELKMERKKPSRLPSMLGPGFQFHPTDEELVQYYLRRRASGKAFRFDAITDVDIYKAEPWDLPSDSWIRCSVEYGGSLIGEATYSFGGIQNHLMSAGDCSCDPNMCQVQNIQNSPASYDIDDTSVKKECTGECSKSGDFDDLSFLLNEPFLDSLDKFADEGFIEANDLSNPFETNATAFDMLEEYLHSGDDSSFYFASDPSMIFGNEDLASNQTLLPQNDLGKGTELAISPNGQLIDNNNFIAVLSAHMPFSTEYQSDFQYPFIKHASQKLGDIHAPPAYAAEFPSKDAVLHLNSAC